MLARNLARMCLQYFEVVVSYFYDSWGKVVSCTGTMAGSLGKLNPFCYRGFVYDEETGFYYLNSRYYDPETGRFLNAEESTVEVFNHVTMGHVYTQIAVVGSDISGKISLSTTTTTQDKDFGIIYSYSDEGKDADKLGVGVNALNFFRADVGVDINGNLFRMGVNCSCCMSNGSNQQRLFNCTCKISVEGMAKGVVGRP